MKKHSTRAYAPLPPFDNHDRALGRALRSPGGFAADAEIPATAALLGAVLFVGLATVGDYGITVDEFNVDDYGPKALAWYTSGFTDRSTFESVEDITMAGSHGSAEAATASVASIKSVSQTVLGSALGKVERSIPISASDTRRRHEPRKCLC